MMRISPQTIVHKIVTISRYCVNYYSSKFYKNNDQDYPLEAPHPKRIKQIEFKTELSLLSVRESNPNLIVRYRQFCRKL